MAVPKRKTSPSKRNMRRSHDSISNLNIIEDIIFEAKFSFSNNSNYLKNQVLDIVFD